MELSRRHWQITIFILTFLCNVARHTVLESWYLVTFIQATPIIHKQHSRMTATWLAACNSAYLFTYAICNFLSGFLEDRYSLKYLISGAMFFSSIFYLLFVLMAFLDVYIPALFVIHWALQGISQSAIWPGIVSVMSNWFTKESRGKSMGFWSANSSVGDIIGLHISGLVLYVGGDWMLAMLPFAIFQIIIAVVFIIVVKDRPDEQVVNELGIAINEEIEGEKVHKVPIPFLEAVVLPGVIPYSLNYACVKFLFYGLLMWLPYFLDSRIDRKEYIALLASLLDVGGIFGSITCGWIGDRTGFRSPVNVAFLACALPLLFILQAIGQDIFWLYFIIIPCIGFCVAGASNVISSAIPADLAQNPEIVNKDEAIATVTGIIDGTGGIGAAIGVLIMGVLSSIDWLYVFLFMITTGIFSILTISHLAYNDLKSYRIRKKSQPVKLNL